MTLRAALIRNLLFPLASRRMGNRFSQEYHELSASQWRSRQELIDLQRGRLEGRLEHAIESVPLYRDWTKERGLSARQIRNPFETILQFPILSKRDIQNLGAKRVLSEAVPERGRIPYSTSGSTGVPFSFQVDRSLVGNKIARYFREMTAWGIEPGTRFLKVWGAGRVSTPGKEEEQGFFTRWVLRREEMSAFDLDLERADQILGYLKEKRIPVLEAYTSTASFLASRCEEKKTELPYLRTVVVSGETLTEDQETRIGKAFGARVLNAYGSREFGRVAFACPEGNGLHFSMEDFFAEYLDLDPPDPDGLKRLVLTCFSNRAQPFIRYDTGDLVLPSEETGCACGRGLPLWRSVAGRLAERVVAPSGRHLSVHYLTLLLEDYESEIRQFQAVVDRPDRLRLLIAPTNALREETAQRIESLLREQVGAGMEVEIERVEEIPVTGDGKRPLLRNLTGVGDNVKGE